MKTEDVFVCNDNFFGVQSYGISVTTLEEVFMKVSGQSIDDDDTAEYHISHNTSDSLVSEASNPALLKPSNTKPLCFELHLKLCRSLCFAVGKGCSLIFAAVCNFIGFFTAKFCGCGMLTQSTLWKHSKALISKRAISARRDRRTIVFQLFIPAVFLLFGLLFLRLKPHPDQDSVTLTTSYFNPLLSGGGGGGPIPFNLTLPIAKQVCSIFDHSFSRGEAVI